MDPIIIRGLDGPAVNGTVWVIGEGAQDLEELPTRKEAIQRARSKWAMPGQEIKVVSTTGSVEVIRQANPSKQPAAHDAGGGPGGGLFGGFF